MNNGYSNIPNNYGMNNNYNNLNNNNDNNGNNGNGSNVLFIGVILLLIVGVVFLILTFIGNNTAEKNLAEEQKKEPTVSEDKKEETSTQPTQPEQTPENNQQNQQQNQQTQNNTNTQTTSKTSLKCTGTAKDEYGTYKYDYSYTFKSNSTMKTATLKTTVTLNSSYVGYRDSLIQSIKDANKDFVKLDGISESVSKKSNGFTYTLKLDASKISTEDLSRMGYRTRNYTGAKMRAKELGLKCS